MHPKCVIEKWPWFKSIGYEPHGAQKLFHNSTAPNRVVSAGWGWGKSMAVARDSEPLLMSPGTQIWIVGPDFGEASREFSFFWHDLVVNKQLPMAEARYNVDQGAMRLRTPDSCGGSLLVVKSERNPHSLEAEDVDRIIYAEAGQLKRSTYERCQGRLRMGGHQDAAFTPEGFNWAYDDLWEPAIDPDEKDWWGHRGPSTENPYLDSKWLKTMQTRLTPAMYEAKIEGRFRTHTGHVFPDFEPAVHMAEIAGTVAGPLYAAVDYGYTNPTVVLDIRVNTKDQVCVVAEYYESFRTSVEHARIIKGWERPYRLMLDDPSGKDEHEIWKKAGLPVQAVTRERAIGFELINELLKIRDDGLPGLILDVSCVNGKREMTKCRWGPTRDSVEAKETPLKIDDHFPEALSRFACWYYDRRTTKDATPKGHGERQFKRERMPRGAI